VLVVLVVLMGLACITHSRDGSHQGIRLNGRALELHERGIYALRAGTGGAAVTQGRCAVTHAVTRLSNSRF
jgi:hypothetical protein